MSSSSKRSLLLDAENLVWFFAIYVLFMTLPAELYAGTNSIAKTICKVAEIFQGQAGRNVASLAIIIVGFGALMGKISAGLCVIVCVGIALIFGASPIAQKLTSQTSGACPPLSATAKCIGTDGTELEKVVRQAVRMITGPIGKAIATVAVVIVGCGALYGKISWPLAIAVALGIALVFGSFTILKLLVGCVDSGIENEWGVIS